MRDLLQNLTQTLLNTNLADIPVKVTLQSTTLGAYDPATGQATREVNEKTVKAVLTGITDKDTNDLELLTKGKKALIAGKDLRGMNLDAVDDTVLVNGQRYQLKSFKVDPVGALYSLMLVARSPSTRGI